MPNSEPVVVFTEENHVGVVTLNRPKKLNSLTMDTFNELTELLQQLSHRRDLRVLVIHGANGTFSSGLSIKEVFTSPSSTTTLLAPTSPHAHNLAQHICCAWRLLPFPVIAAIEGHCFGGGLQLAMGADMRFAAPNAQLSILEARWGLVPDMGLAVTGDCISADWKGRLMMSGEILDVARAKDAGLVTEVVTTVPSPKNTETVSFSASFLQLRDERLRAKVLQVCEHYLQCNARTVACAKKLRWDAQDQWTWSGSDACPDPGHKKGQNSDRRWGAWIGGAFDNTRLKQEERLQVGLLKVAAQKIMSAKL
jgi:enoyl-CoA hydratase/carnithine racemase